ncbi:MAG: MATE family efflux transporter [Spirochaetes bacterium]|jgi:putative MATE family efflux protein|nr:MATE family efflux transporter [Spirochaetota bacterium]
MFYGLFEDRLFLKKLFITGFPVAIEIFLISLLGLVDNFMIGQLGSVSIAAVGLAFQIMFLLIVFLFGLNSGAAIFHAQYWGKKDLTNIHRLLGVSLITGVTVCGLVSLSVVFFPSYIMRIFTTDTAVIAIGSDYFSIVGATYIFMAIGFSFSFACRCTGHPFLPTLTSLFAVILNTGLNYLLIFGNHGFPEMGVRGAALATLISNATGTCLFVILVYARDLHIAAPLRELFDISLTFIRRVFKVMIFSIITTVAWGLGMIMYNMIFARISTEAIAAFTILSVVSGLAFSFIDGFSTGTSIVIGNTLGENESERAYLYGKRSLVLVFIFSLFVGTIIYFLAPIIVSVYNIPDSTRELALRYIKIFSIIYILKSQISTMVNGILKSGGDTRFILIIDPGVMYLVGVCGGVLAAFYFNVNPLLVYVIMNTEEVIKIAIAFPRFLSKKWVNHLAD